MMSEVRFHFFIDKISLIKYLSFLFENYFIIQSAGITKPDNNIRKQIQVDLYTGYNPTQLNLTFFSTFML